MEIVTYGFDASINNFRFNPLIADLPEIKFEHTSPPSIWLLYTDTAGKTTTVSSSRSASSSTTVTTGQETGASTTLEYANSFGGTVGLTYGKDGVGGSISANYQRTITNTSEQSFKWTSEQSSENGVTLDSGNAFEQKNEINSSGGIIGITAKITNVGNRPFTVNSMILSSYIVDPISQNPLATIGNLGYQDPGGGEAFSAFSLAGGRSTGNLNFNTSLLDLTLVRDLLKNSSNMIVGPSSVELTSENGTPTAFDAGLVQSICATIVIDYAGLKKQERHSVSTVASPSIRRPSIKSLFEDILKTPFATDSSGHLTTVRGVKADAARFAKWVVVHTQNDGVSQTTTIYESNGTAYDFSKLRIQAGDILALTFMIDEDGDSIGIRQEALYGTDPKNPDTDSDGLTDKQESTDGWKVTVYGHTPFAVKSSPTKSDIDQDGLTDSQEKALLTNPNSADTDGDLFSDAMDPTPLTATNYSPPTPTAKADVPTSKINVSWTNSTSAGPQLDMVYLLQQKPSTSGPYLPEPSPAAMDNTDPLAAGTTLSWSCRANGFYGAATAVGVANDTIGNCWDVIASGASLSSFAVSVTDGYQGRYALAYLYSNNGKKQLIFGTPSQPAAFNIPMKKIRITLLTTSVGCDADFQYHYTPKSRYGKNVWKTVDRTCEVYYDMRIDQNTPFYKVDYSQTRAVSGGATLAENTWDLPTPGVSIGINGSLSIDLDVPDVTGSTRTLTFRGWERESLINDTSYDEKVEHTITLSYANGWGWGSGNATTIAQDKSTPAGGMTMTRNYCKFSPRSSSINGVKVNNYHFSSHTGTVADFNFRYKVEDVTGLVP